MAGFDPSKYGSKKSKIYGSSAADTRVDSGTETGFDPSRYGDSKSKLYSPGSMVITPEPVETQQKKRERQVVSPYGTFLGGFSFAGDRQKTAKELADEKAEGQRGSFFDLRMKQRNVRRYVTLLLLFALVWRSPESRLSYR